MSPSFSSILNPYKLAIEHYIQQNITALGVKNDLRDACEYALLNGGKRFRPILVLMIAKALGFGVDVLPAAMGVECFHTASLIADDLPCMDNDDERRNKPTVHRVYGESTALLATYGLIAAGYGCLAKNAFQIRNSSHPFAEQSDHLGMLALENASYNTGLLGATGGQFLDLCPSTPTVAYLKEVNDKKTGTLFEISFVLGWLFGGGESEKLPIVKKSASHFGMAFQIADDIDDMAQDVVNERAINMANVLGKEEAIKMFHQEMEMFEKSLRELKLDKSDLHLLGCSLKAFLNETSL